MLFESEAGHIDQSADDFIKSFDAPTCAASLSEVGLDFADSSSEAAGGALFLTIRQSRRMASRMLADRWRHDGARFTHIGHHEK